MELKQKWRRFWTLNRHHEDGFTLVELVVVIAIMAILAGVGSAGYTAYLTSSNKGNDKVLVGNVMRALETAAYSYTADFAVDGQYSTGLQIPVGYVVLTTEGIEAVSNDTENNPIDKALVAAMGADYSTNYKLSYDKWETGTIGGSTLHNATVGMLDKINSTGDLMIALQDLVPLTAEKYDDSGDLIISVAGNISDFDGDGVVTDNDKTAFVQKWLAESNTAYSSVGFGMAGRENYSAVRLAYNNSFAEYVRANYDGNHDADILANNIANYGQSAGQLAYDEAYDIAYGNGKGTIYTTAYNAMSWLGNKAATAAGEKACEASADLAKSAANAAAPNATFSYTANATAFDDPNYPGYGDETLKALYNEWLAGPAANDAAMFYDTMVTAAVDGAKYAEQNGTDNFVDWFADQAKTYSDNMNAVQDKVAGKSGIVVTAYYQNGLMAFDVYSAEADPRND